MGKPETYGEYIAATTSQALEANAELRRFEEKSYALRAVHEGCAEFGTVYTRFVAGSLVTDAPRLWVRSDLLGEALSELLLCERIEVRETSSCDQITVPFEERLV
jgi:hypothetical protein